MATNLFVVLSVAEQLAAFDAATPRSTSAVRQALRRSIERGWVIFDPVRNRFQITGAGRDRISTD